VKLAQAIAHDPQLVLLDEPTDGLDPVQRDDMLALIKRVGTEFGIDIILSSHLLEEVERVCDSAVIIAGGEVVASGPITELTGADRGLLIEVDDHVGDLILALRASGVEVTVDGTRLVVTGALGGADDALYDVVRDAVAATGAGLRRLTNRTVSLEDVFLEVGT
jgi:ABC-2 type transport system ATP-binding protein